ncbi:tetratricopeptide repeat protein [Subsaximicrobium wynnwilliamsii]|uniref:histidine kinase n=1 Tax=Subsaximicrobium wynnwilliamsii TaxID=291179 RepID=A0A5C6ZDV2_9FLAO|nr:tetratricopeptide repeat-containing sensor histidine kinase [Subsaximicrobium wynnwilliamsii]TXD82117.1 tetratricopeptide repeat protein [Subsaximicrobium wynnwilliamsii]TXD87762.1 tetratricopeptide repeat protein [Subsaximicrobium wynnwilliamsii]TXE01573.1 tetratricopeptide repeat protein [Subsaximicrobium wynnwilliamsii]
MLVRKNKLIILLVGFILCVLSSCRRKTPNHNEIKSFNDSVNYYLKQNRALSKAKTLNDLIENDSLKKENALKIAFQAFKNSDTLLFENSNKQALRLSIELKDSSGVAETHWNSGSFFARQEILDSAYYHYYQAHKYYSLIGQENYSAKMLYNMAFIQSRLKDYTSSEAKLFQAISTYKNIGKDLALYKCYNALGNNYSELGDFENSIEYHTKSIKVLENIDDKNKPYYERTLNDIGLTYQIKKDYNTSIQTFRKALDNKNIKNQDIRLYARLKDNLAYSKLLYGDTVNVEDYFLEALKIRDSLNNISGITINKIHLAEYYAKTNDTIKALEYAEDANKLAIKSSNNNDILSSLLLLSKIDKINSSKYLQSHVKLTKELQGYERKLKNKFARISFETDEYIHKNERLSLQKTLILSIAIGVISILTLLYYLRIQKTRNKQLVLEKQQQKANEEIYKLMIKQQSKLEEGRLKERCRISEELHDGVLGKIYGARMGIGFLNLNGESEDLKKHQKFLEDLQSIEGEIRDISHELKNEILSSNTDYLAMIESLVLENSLIGKFKYDIIAEETLFWNDSNEGIKINMYRIIQEALQNIVKHSKATHVALKFEYNNFLYNVVITDNGVGFNTSKRKNGIGLSNIKSRVKGLNGSLTLNSDSKSGTIIEIKIPSN